MRILALDSALGRCSAGLVVDGVLVADVQENGGRGQAGRLPALVVEVLEQAACAATMLDFVAVTVGPGSFTGIRAGLSLAHGLALGAGIAVIGVTIGEAFADSLPHLGGRALWSAIDSRRGRVFLERGGTVAAWSLASLPVPDRPVAVAGDAAIPVASALAAGGRDVMLTDARLPLVRHVAMAALARRSGRLPPRSPQPLYVDAPEARPPAGGLRPPPVAAAATGR